MESVMNQTSKEFEYIVVDGTGENSDDSEQLKSFVAQKLDTIGGYVACEWQNGITGGFYSDPDKGIYNAMNKGILKAKGEYVHFLNSGDWLVDERVVEDMLNELYHNTEQFTESVSERSRTPIGSVQVIERSRNDRPDIFVGNVIQIRPVGKKRYTKQQDKNVSLMTFYRGTIQHTSAYIKRSLFDKYGLYDETLKIVSDWKWYMQVAGLNKANVQFTDRYVTYFDMTGISSTNLELDKAERRQVLEELIPAPILEDYDKYAFEIEQIKRLKRYPVFYKMVWFVERVLFKRDKWRGKREWR